jgi:hypothetical protein
MILITLLVSGMILAVGVIWDKKRKIKPPSPNNSL